ncbi:MAG: hypothetical protein H7145_00870 [Akkermansiaceae bacterium]|nr:hypothetical protein [Armatimonadota bacterium]
MWASIIGYPLLIIIECKDYKCRVEIGKVDELIGKIDDVGAARGILVSDSGENRANDLLSGAFPEEQVIRDGLNAVSATGLSTAF